MSTARVQRLSARRPGFTLIETLIVAVIMGILLVMGVPQVFWQMRSSQADRAAFVIAQDLESAFSLAARQRAPVTFTVNGTNMSYRIRNRATSALLTERYLSASTSPYGVTALAMSISTLTVFPNGMASGAAVVTLGVANRTRTVSLTRAGQIRIGS
jgi:prepilin-type N-terminal cleavage/methylation domain-containing protein